MPHPDITDETEIAFARRVNSEYENAMQRFFERVDRERANLNDEQAVKIVGLQIDADVADHYKEWLEEDLG